MLTWTEVEAGWPGRDGHAVVVHGGKLWLYGGRVGSNVGDLRNDIWSSDDGITWTSHGNAAWSARAGMAMAVLGGVIYMVGGGWPSSTNSHLSDVWSSSDGTTWTQLLADGAPAFGGRFYHGLVVHDGALILAGGNRASSNQGWRDVWSSVNGTAWTQLTASAEWTWRQQFGFFSFGGSLHIAGGIIVDAPSSANTNERYSSPTGATWTLLSPNGPFSASNFMGGASGADRMLLAGAGSPAEQVWASTGAGWTQETSLPIVVRRPVVVFFEGRFHVIGGFNNEGFDYLNKVFYSERLTPSIPVSGGTSFSSTVKISHLRILHGDRDIGMARQFHDSMRNAS